MNDRTKTISFACVSGVMVGLAALTWIVTQPKKIAEFENVGAPFFENFEGSDQARSLEVRAIDAETAKLKQFRVEEKDGVWTIPSHYGYPAEASDRLASTSSSLIGLKRESLVGRLKKDHERFGVVDPLNDENVDPDAAGKRITLKDESGDVLVDLIIGHESDAAQATEAELAFGQTANRTSFYVRHPGEDQTYKVGMDLELSTKFSDWIRPDLLNLDVSELRRISIDNYELKEQADPLGRLTRLFKKQGDQMLFSRDTGFGPWTMADLNEDQQQLDSGKINTAANTLGDLRIVGVRKKTSYEGQQLLNPDLTLNRIPALEKNIPLFRQIMGQLQQELSDYGFNLTPTAPNSEELMLVSNFGEMTAGTEDGVVYTLQFGNPVSGDENEIEIGSRQSDTAKDESASSKTETSVTSEDTDEADETTGDGAEPATEDSADDAKEEIKNRFLMIRVAFDETILGEKPVAPEAPVEPTKPEGYVPAPEITEDAAADPAVEKSDDAPSPDQQDEGTESPEDPHSEPDSESDAKDERPVEFKDYDLSKQEYEQKKTEYELKLSKYEDDIKQYNEKVEAGQNRVAELNERFGEWFYVISADNLESLQLTKADLVSDKEKAAPADENKQLPARPDINIGDELKGILNENSAGNRTETPDPTDGESKTDQPVSEGDSRGGNS